MVGDGSPTALQGSTMSLIQGVVTVLLKVRIRAGAVKSHVLMIIMILPKRIGAFLCVLDREIILAPQTVLSCFLYSLAHWVNATMSLSI